MAFKRGIYWLLIVVLTAINAYIIMHRNEGYKYYPYKSYNELYVMDSSLYIKQVYFTNDSLMLTLSVKLPAVEYIIKRDTNTIAKAIAHSNEITIPVQNGLHNYQLIPQAANALAFTITVNHDAPYKNHPSYTNEFLHSSIPGPAIHLQTMSLHLWQHGLETYSREEQLQGIELLKKHTKVFALTSDFEKALEIAKFVAALPSNPKGSTPAELYGVSGCKQIQVALQNKAKLDCGNYHTIVSFLCSLAGIPNRSVYYFGPNGNWMFGVHYLNEIYLREKQQWAMMDGTFNIYLLHDSTRFYNVADIKRMTQTNSLQGKLAFTYVNNNFVKTTSYSLAGNLAYYNRSDADLVFNYPGTNAEGSTLQYLVNFYSFSNRTALYTDAHRNEWNKIMIKMIAFYGLLLLLLWYAISEWKYYKKQKP